MDKRIFLFFEKFFIGFPPVVIIVILNIDILYQNKIILEIKKTIIIFKNAKLNIKDNKIRSIYTKIRERKLRSFYQYYLLFH